METENCTPIAPSEVKKEEPPVTTELTTESTTNIDVKPKETEQLEQPTASPTEVSCKVEEPAPIVELKTEAPEAGK